MEQQMKLLQTVVEQQQSYIQAQNALVAEKDARMAEKDETIAQLRKLVDDLQSLKANLEETLRELRRQLFGTISERTIAEEPDAEESITLPGTFDLQSFLTGRHSFPFLVTTKFSAI